MRGQLRRSRSDKVIGGVAGGLAEYSGIDALLWRVGFVALAFAGGTGVLVYLLLWLLMPAGDSGPAGGPAGYGPPGYGSPAGREDRGPRSPVPGLTVAALLVVVGLLALLAQVTAWSPGPRVFVAAALLVVGLGLVAAAFVPGRSGTAGLVTLGIVLSLALLVASAAPWPDIRGGVGDRTWAPATPEQVRPVYRAGVGDTRLDLSGIEVGDLDEPVRTRLLHGIGDVDVVVPHDADVSVSVDVRIGETDILDGSSSDGGFFPGEGSGSWVDDGEPEIVLEIESSIGEVAVSRG